MCVCFFLLFVYSVYYTTWQKKLFCEIRHLCSWVLFAFFAYSTFDPEVYLFQIYKWDNRNAMLWFCELLESPTLSLCPHPTHTHFRGNNFSAKSAKKPSLNQKSVYCSLLCKSFVPVHLDRKHTELETSTGALFLFNPLVDSNDNNNSTVIIIMILLLIIIQCSISN